MKNAAVDSATLSSFADTSWPQVWRRPLIALCACMAWVIFWYWGSVAAMVGIWYRAETYAHGFIVVPIVLWLIWRERHRLVHIAPRPSVGVLIPLAVVGLGWLLGELSATSAVTLPAFTALLVLTVPAILGIRLAQAIVFPLAFTFFAPPIGEFIVPQLMEWTADFTVLALRVTGIPVYRDGMQFVIPSGSWSVVEACSGVRYLIASFTVGTLFAYLNYRSLKRRLLFVAVSIIVPIIANWFRAYMIVMLGHFSSNRLAVGVDHLIYGWLFFGVVMVLMFMIGARWREDVPADAAVATRSPGATRGREFPLWLAVAAVVAVTAWPPLAFRMIERSDVASAPQLLAPAVGTTGAWLASATPVVDWRPAFSGTPSAESMTTWVHQGRVVGLYLGYYRNQNYTRKLVSSSNMLVHSADRVWAQVSSGTRKIAFNRQAVTVRTAELGGSVGDAGSRATRLLVWKLYWVNGRLTASDHAAKAYSAVSRLLGQGDDSAVIILYAPMDQDGGGNAALAAFAEAAGAAIEESLRRTREAR